MELRLGRDDEHAMIGQPQAWIRDVVNRACPCVWPPGERDRVFTGGTRCQHARASTYVVRAVAPHAATLAVRA